MKAYLRDAIKAASLLSLIAISMATSTLVIITVINHQFIHPKKQPTLEVIPPDTSLTITNIPDENTVPCSH